MVLFEKAIDAKSKWLMVYKQVKKYTVHFKKCKSYIILHALTDKTLC